MKIHPEDGGIMLLLNLPLHYKASELSSINSLKTHRFSVGPTESALLKKCSYYPRSDSNRKKYSEQLLT